MPISVRPVDVTTSLTAGKPTVSVVVVSPALTDIGVENPIALVSSETLAAQIAVAVPVSQIAYVSLVASARIDDSGLYRLAVDSVTLVDRAVMAIVKTIRDTVTISDDLLSANMAYETLSIEDAVTVVLVRLRTLADSVGSVSDAQVLELAKTAVSQALTSDEFANSVYKNFDDATAILSEISLAFATTIAEEVFATDTFTVGFGKTAAEAVTTAETTTFVVDRVAEDAPVFTDADTKAIAKLLQDAVGVNDFFGYVYGMVATVNNVATPTDQSTVTAQPLYSDTIALTEAGRIVAQGYCDLTYFADDYVGSVLVF